MKQFLREWLGINQDYDQLSRTINSIRSDVRDIRFGNENYIQAHNGKMVTHEQAIEAILSHLDVRIMYEPATPSKVVILPKMHDDEV